MFASGYDVTHFLSGLMLLISFMLLYQDRMFPILNVFAVQAVVLALAVAWQAFTQDAPHLYITAGLALVMKAGVIPWALHRIVRKLGIHRDIETVVGVGMTLIAAVLLTILAILIVVPMTEAQTASTREDLAFALAIILLGLLMMIMRRNAISQIVGFMSRKTAYPGRHRRQESPGGRDQRHLLGPDRLFRLRRLRLPHPRTLRHHRHQRPRPVQGRTQMTDAGLTLVLCVPIAAAALLAMLSAYRVAALVNIAASLLSFAAAVTLFWVSPETGDILFVDGFNIYLIALNTFVGLTTSIFSATYISHELETGRLTPVHLRFYHAMFQLMMGAMNLALASNNIGLMWVGIEVATLTTVLMVGIYRTHEAIEAAWKYFILGSVGISLAFFGTILIYLVAQPVVGEGLPAMCWTTLLASAAGLEPHMLNLAFVFLLIGYGTKVGLAPMHAWLPDAHAEGPTPGSAVLSGLLLNVALYAVLRFKMILAANPDTLSPGPALVVMGLVSLLFASLMLYRRRDIKRLFAYSSIEHMGIITFAFGLGGPIANFAGLLHMTMHSLTKSAIFYAVGHVAQVKGTQKIEDIRGLSVSHPALAWGLGLGVVAIAGLPPFGVFASEFLIVTTTFAREPWLAALFAAGLLLGFGALLMRLQSVLFGEPSGHSHPLQASLAPLFAHLALILWAGISLPRPLVEWFQRVAVLLG
jgi:hydrogenase-4 component F